MPLTFGNNPINALYLGNQGISAVYCGADKIWPEEKFLGQVSPSGTITLNRLGQQISGDIYSSWQNDLGQTVPIAQFWFEFGMSRRWNTAVVSKPDWMHTSGMEIWAGPIPFNRINGRVQSLMNNTGAQRTGTIVISATDMGIGQVMGNFTMTVVQITTEV